MEDGIAAAEKLGGALEVLYLDGLHLGRIDLLELLVELYEGVGALDLADVYPRPRLVKGIDGLVGLLTVGDVAVGELDAGLEGFVGIDDVVMLLIFALDIVQDLERLGGGAGIDENLLEAPLQGTVLLDGLAVFVKRGGSDALQGAAAEGRLEDIGGIHAACGAAGSHDGVDLIDEEDDVGMACELTDDALYALLKLSAVLGAGDEAAHVEGDDALVDEGHGHLHLDDTLCEPLDDGGLADAGFSDEDGVILLAAGEDLGDALYLARPADDRVELALGGIAGDVDAVLVEKGGVGLLPVRAFLRALLRAAARGAVGTVIVLLLVFAEVQVGSRLLLLQRERLADQVVGDAAVIEDLASLGLLVTEDGQQEMLGTHGVVTLLFGFGDTVLERTGGTHLEGILIVCMRGDAKLGELAEVLLQSFTHDAHGGTQLCDGEGTTVGAFAQDAQHEVLGTDEHVVETHGLLATIDDALREISGIGLVHGLNEVIN